MRYWFPYLSVLFFLHSILWRFDSLKIYGKSRDVELVYIQCFFLIFCAICCFSSFYLREQNAVKTDDNASVLVEVFSRPDKTEVERRFFRLPYIALVLATLSIISTIIAYAAVVVGTKRTPEQRAAEDLLEIEWLEQQSTQKG